MSDGDDLDWKHQTLAAMGVSLSNLSGNLLRELLKDRGPGDWIEQLKQDAIREVKGMITEGVAIEDEPQMYAAAITAVEAVFLSIQPKPD
jgi:hypothetical protein